MRFKHVSILLILLLSSPLFLSCGLTSKVVAQTAQSLYFGVDVAFENIAATEQLIDNVSTYTNFFIIGCLGNYNETRLNILSQYVYDKGLSFIVYTDEQRYPSAQWFADARNKWGDKFLGIYFYDEPGGKQLDQTKYPVVTGAYNYSDAANRYDSYLNWWLRSGPYAITKNFAYPNEYQLFTSDYALYWYDYEAGYDTVFAEFGNQIGSASYSRQLNVALDRGAATTQNKDWGVMITLTSNETPTMESGAQLYNDTIWAYENGAKYIVVFDSNINFTQNVLEQSHLDSMKQFWQYVQANPRNVSPVSDRTAYVLPDSFAYGFRSPEEDSIWGLWTPKSDPELYNFTLDISMGVAALLNMNGPNLDVVYPDQLEAVESVGYRHVVFWNDSELVQGVPAMPIPSPVLPVSQTNLYSPPNRSSLEVDLSAIGVYVIIVAVILVAIAFALVFSKFRRKVNKKLTLQVSLMQHHLP